MLGAGASGMATMHGVDVGREREVTSASLCCRIGWALVPVTEVGNTRRGQLLGLDRLSLKYLWGIQVEIFDCHFDI